METNNFCLVKIAISDFEVNYWVIFRNLFELHGHFLLEIGLHNFEVKPFTLRISQKWFCLGSIHAGKWVPLFLPSPFVTYCGILSTSLWGKGPNLRQWLVAQPSSTVSLAEVFLSCKANARRSVHSPRYHLIITHIIWRLTWLSGKVVIGPRNPERSWWHRHTSLKLFWPRPMAPWATGSHPYNIDTAIENFNLIIWNSNNSLR